MGSIQGLGSSNSAWAAVSSQRAARPPGGGDATAFQDKLFAKLDADSSGGVDSGELQGLLDKLSSKLGTSVGGSDPAAAFSAMDQNGDGSLDKSELDTGLKNAMAALPDTVSFAQSRGAGGNAAARFAKADTDGSGGLSADELKAALEASPRAHGQAVSQDKVDAMMAKLDTDGSGEISATEMAAGRHGAGSTAAAGNAGGQPAGVGGPPHGGGAHGDSDGDSDGGSSTSSTAIDPLDTNGDGTVSASERTAGALKDVMKALAKAADSNGDGQVSRSEGQRFGELLSQLSSGSAASPSSSSSSSDAGGTSRRQHQADSAHGLADQVLRHYAQAAANASAGSSLSVEA